MGFDWRQAFSCESTEVVGLDIGSSSVKAVQLRKNASGYGVVAAGIVQTGDDQADGQVSNQATADAIRNCLSSAGVQTRMAVCGVSGPEVAVRYFEFPSLPRDEVAGAIMLEASQVCPFNVDAGTVDYQLMPNARDTMSGMLVAATNKVIKTKAQVAEHASLKCVLMDVDGLALLNCLSGFEGAEDAGDQGRRTTSAILNVGSSYTTLAIAGVNGLPFVREIAYAGNDIIDQIAKANATPRGRICRILSGAKEPAEGEHDLHERLAHASQKLVVDIAETLRYYNAQEKSAFVDKILVCGGFALVKGFVELLDNQLPAKAILWNPFEKSRCDGDQKCRAVLSEKGPAMAVAAGLAMRKI